LSTSPALCNLKNGFKRFLPHSIRDNKQTTWWANSHSDHDPPRCEI